MWTGDDSLYRSGYESEQGCNQTSRLICQDSHPAPHRLVEEQIRQAQAGLGEAHRLAGTRPLLQRRGAVQAAMRGAVILVLDPGGAKPGMAKGLALFIKG